jgi:hypothetical protein
MAFLFFSRKSKQWPLAGEFVEFEYSPKIHQNLGRVAIAYEKVKNFFKNAIFSKKIAKQSFRWGESSL